MAVARWASRHGDVGSETAMASDQNRCTPMAAAMTTAMAKKGSDPFTCVTFLPMSDPFTYVSHVASDPGRPRTIEVFFGPPKSHPWLGRLVYGLCPFFQGGRNAGG